MDPDYGISRLDQESAGTHGWQVRLQKKGVRYGRFFSDSAWGGREESLQIARQYRDRILGHSRRIHSGREASNRSHKAPASRNRSGVVGVTRIIQKSAKGVEYRYWQASWTRYSVLKYGEQTAFELACIARREALE